MTTKITPQDRRFQAMRAMCDTVVSIVPNEAQTQMVNVYQTTDRAEIASRIRTLVPLGRTERWQGQIEGWARLVEDTDNPLEWAFLQGSIWASYAA